MFNFKNAGHKIVRKKFFAINYFSEKIFTDNEVLNNPIFKKIEELPNLNSFRRSYKIMLKVEENSIYPELLKYAEEVESGEKPFSGKKIINFKQQSDDKINCQILNILNFDMQNEMLREIGKILKSPNSDPQNMSIFVDGGCSGLLKTGSFGISVFSNQDRKICVLGNIGNDSTNNVAEYFSLTFILLILSQINNFKIKNLRIYADSQLLVRQIKKEYQIKTNHILILYTVLANILKKIKTEDLKIIHVLREFNKEADYLANLAKLYNSNTIKIYF
jgi:ribonuclease HI